MLADDIHKLQQSVQQLREGTVLTAEIVDDHIEVEVRIAPSGKEIWAELVDGLGGAGGGLVRVPAEGDSVLVGMIDGDPNRGFVLGRLSDESTPMPKDVEGKRTYVVAPDGEGVEIRAGDGSTTVEIEPDGTVRLDAKEVDLIAQDINLGSDEPVDTVALDSKVLSELSKLIAWSGSHVHTYLAPLVPLPGPPVPTTPAPPAPPASSVGSSKVNSD